MHSESTNPAKKTTKVHHLNCGIIQVPPNPRAICHCLLLADEKGLALVDTGIGLKEVQNPLERVGKELIETVGFQFHEALTAIRQIEKMGYTANDVSDIILTHGDNDHVGGLADFPQAVVHISEEEYQAMQQGFNSYLSQQADPASNLKLHRYLPQQFEHNPTLKLHACSDTLWFGLEAREIPLGFASKILFIPLFGHTLGQCGVAIEQGQKWLLHVGDAYYLRVETFDENHPVSELTTVRAEDNEARRRSLEEIKHLMRDHSNEIEIFGYHDEMEFDCYTNS